MNENVLAIRARIEAMLALLGSAPSHEALLFSPETAQPSQSALKIRARIAAALSPDDHEEG